MICSIHCSRIRRMYPEPDTLQECSAFKHQRSCFSATCFRSLHNNAKRDNHTGKNVLQILEITSHKRIRRIHIQTKRKIDTLSSQKMSAQSSRRRETFKSLARTITVIFFGTCTFLRFSIVTTSEHPLAGHVTISADCFKNDSIVASSNFWNSLGIIHCYDNNNYTWITSLRREHNPLMAQESSLKLPELPPNTKMNPCRNKVLSASPHRLVDLRSRAKKKKK